MLAEDGGVNKKLNLRGALEKYKNPEKIKEEKKRGRLIALKNTIIVDANVILRYLLNDNQEQSKKANQTKLLFNQKSGFCWSYFVGICKESSS
jgi:hypothetical protein